MYICQIVVSFCGWAKKNTVYIQCRLPEGYDSMLQLKTQEGKTKCLAAKKALFKIHDTDTLK